MSEKITSVSSEVEATETNAYDGFSREDLNAVAAARESVDPESETPGADLRQAVRGALEESGDERAFRRVYDMNNLELNSFAEGATGELKDRRVDELKSLIDAYDGNDSFGDRRTAIRQALEDAGDSRAFRTVYDMNNLDITSFVEDARRQLQEETALDQDAALEAAHEEYEEREGAPYDADKGRVKDVEDVRTFAGIEEISRRIDSNPEAAKAAGINEKLQAILDELDSPLVTSSETDNDDVELGSDEELAKLEKSVNKPDDEPELGTDAELDALAATSNLEKHGLDEAEEDRKQYEADQRDLADERDRAADQADLADERDREADEHDLEEENQTKSKWWKNPYSRLGAWLTVGAGSLREKWEKKGKKTKFAIIALGTVAAVGIAVGMKYGLGHNGGGGHNVGPDDIPGGNGNGGGHETDLPPHNPTTTPSPEFSSAAHRVDPGEGWYQTFKDMDVPANERADLLQKVGPKLAENGWAYKMPSGEWGISHPGQLPDSMLELIKNSR